jgi:hypothetical protein
MPKEKRRSGLPRKKKRRNRQQQLSDKFAFDSSKGLQSTRR